MQIKLIAWITLIAGAVMAGYFGFLFCRWNKIKDWVPVSAKILDRVLKEGYRTIGVARLITYTPEVAYEYQYKGLSYTGSKITVRDTNLASVEVADAKAILDGLSTLTTAYIDPCAPHNSYLVNKLKWRDINFLFTYIVSGLLLMGIGLGLLVI